MNDCSINNGRLLAECLDKSAGVKTLFFMRHDELLFTKDINGVIDTLAPATIYRFEQEKNLSSVLQTVIRGQAESIFVKFNSEGFHWKTRLSDLSTMEALRAGKWAVFYLDYSDNIRLLGEETAMVSPHAIEMSGTAPESDRVLNFSHEGNSTDWAPFLAPFTDYPFDNFPGIIIVPPYIPEPGLILQNDLLDYIKVDNAGNRLDYN